MGIEFLKAQHTVVILINLLENFFRIRSLSLTSTLRTASSPETTLPTLPIRTILPSLPNLSTLALQRAHVFHLFELFRCQDIFQFRLGLRFEGGNFFLLLIRQLELFLSPWWQQAQSDGLAGDAFALRRALIHGGRRSVLRRDEARGSTEG